MDYISFAKSYHDISGISVTVLHGSEVVYSSLGEQLGIHESKRWEQPFPPDMPCFGSLDDKTLYGLICAPEEDWFIVLGPALCVPLTDEVLDSILHISAIPLERRGDLFDALYQLPTVTPSQLTKHIAFVHQCLHGEAVSDAQIYQYIETEAPQKGLLHQRIESLEEGRLHNSYYYEVGLYQMVREGNTANLNRFFEKNRHLSLNEGVMALSPLRHAKNVFITTVSRVGFIGAIPGGLDVEKAYQMMDDYIRRCEQLSTVEEVASLQYAMIHDFCQHTGENQRPANLSTDVWHCMNYIRSHLYERLSVEQVAHDLGKSTSYIQKHFRAELDTSVNAYILRSKLEEAKTLLIYSDKTLAQISFDLCFSSQPYFHQCFKQAFGVTPSQYRQNGRTI
ncbi:MAG: AraC family transcriptional regulator [Clostridia bacterium]|nr:AraC family transcriptional regulator [Clostridia bacterium]